MMAIHKQEAQKQCAQVPKRRRRRAPPSKHEKHSEAQATKQPQNNEGIAIEEHNYWSICAYSSHAPEQREKNRQ
jgi:hypothetical protein